MNAAQVLSQARALGIILSGESGKLRFEAPAGRLTEELREWLTVNKAEILDLLEVERFANRRIVRCADCKHFLPSPPIYRAHGGVWETPGGCVENRTSPAKHPPIYPCSGWYCDGWASRRSI